MRIGIDLDGCVYDYVDAVRRYILATDTARTPDDLPEPQQWEIWESWGMTRDEFWTWAAAGIDAGVVFGSGDPIPGARAALWLLTHAGHTLHIVTARRQTAQAVGLTVGWLDQQRIPRSTITFASDKTVVPVDLFVEDTVRNADAIADVDQVAVLIDQPWNRHDRRHLRAANWQHVVDIVQALA